VSLAVDVRQERAEVLLLTDRPGWDIRFLSLAASREPRLELTRVFSGPDGPVHADSLRQWSEPESVEEWLRWDGLILGGWGGPAGRLDWQRLGEAVEAGLGLLVLPGDGASNPALRLPPVPGGLGGLLPVRVPEPRRRVAGAEPMTVVLPPAGRSHAILEGLVAGAGGGGSGSWDDLPPLRAILPVELLPASRSLIEVRGRARPGERLATEVLVAVAERGQGRTGWYGGRNLWEQAFWTGHRSAGGEVEPGGQVARQLARNLLLWTAEGEAERELAFAGRRLAYQEGETIRISSIWSDLRGQPVTGRRQELTLRASAADSAGAAGEERTFELEEIEGRPGEAEVELPPLPPGAYSVQLTGDGDPPVVSRRENLVVTRNSIEATQVRQDPRRLRQLASGARDRYVDGHEADALGRILAALQACDWQAGARERRSRFDPLAGWPLLVVAALLLGAEWFLRRRNGLL